MPTIDPQIIIVGVQLLLSVVGNLTSNAAVQAAIAAIQKWLPTIIAEIPDLYSDARGILDTLRGKDNLTDEQVATIDTLRLQLDADSAALIYKIEKE